MLPFTLDRSQSEPIYRQLYLRFRESIADGRLRPGDRVPAVRALAAELNLARGTVEAAYQLLIGEGYLIARGAAGTVVTPHLPPVPTPTPRAPLASTQYQPTHSGELPLALQMGLPALDKTGRPPTAPGWPGGACLPRPARACPFTRGHRHLPGHFTRYYLPPRAGVRVCRLSCLPGPDQPHLDAPGRHLLAGRARLLHGQERPAGSRRAIGADPRG